MRHETGDRIHQRDGRYGSTALAMFGLMFLVSCLLAQDAAFSGEKPSLFRGVVLANSSSGVRVVSVDDGSRAHLADVRPEDIIVRVQDADVRTIDEFAAVSGRLRGTVEAATVLVFRNGTPHELTVHLYSYPVLRAWQIEIVPEHDIRFAEPATGRDYWLALGRGFEEADNPEQALNACLNALHNVPEDVPTALKVSGLYTALSRERLKAGDLAGGMDRLSRAVTIMNSLFNRRLTLEQMELVKQQLTEALHSLRDASKAAARPIPPAS